METIITRLDAFIKYKNLSYNSFAAALGYDSSEKISRLFRLKDARPSYDIIHDIANKFVELDLLWLVTGKGTMLAKPSGIKGKGELYSSDTDKSAKPSSVKEHDGLYNSKSIRTGIDDALNELLNKMANLEQEIKEIKKSVKKK